MMVVGTDLPTGPLHVHFSRVQKMSCLNAPMVQPEYLCQKDAAVLIGRSVAFLQKLARNGEGPRVYRHRRAAIYKVSELRQFVEQSQS